jgi:hypothetical protein
MQSGQNLNVAADFLIESFVSGVNDQMTLRQRENFLQRRRDDDVLSAHVLEYPGTDLQIPPAESEALFPDDPHDQPGLPAFDSFQDLRLVQIRADKRSAVQRPMPANGFTISSSFFAMFDGPLSERTCPRRGGFRRGGVPQRHPLNVPNSAGALLFRFLR